METSPESFRNSGKDSTKDCMSAIEEMDLELLVLAWKASIICLTDSARSP